MIFIPNNYHNFNVLFDYLESYNKATDVIFSDEKRNSSGYALFISEDNKITRIAYYIVGSKIASNRRRLTLSNPIDPETEISLQELKTKNPTIRRYISEYEKLTDIVFCTEVTGRKIWKYLVEVCPNIEEHFKLNKPSIIKNYYHIQRMEYDAVSMPLKIAGIDSIELKETSGTIFDKIDADSITEDQAIFKDAIVFSNPLVWSTDFKGKRIINNTGNMVDLWYANRNKYESLIGVDLILFHKIHNAFLLIQYKRMKKEGEQQVYRIDTQFQSEIQRMEKTKLILANNTASRLNPDPFFLRFCWEKNNDCCSTNLELLKGMNVPLGFFQNRYRNGGFATAKGAQVVTAESIGNYLDNSTFISLFKNGWIGTEPIDSNQLQEYVSKELDNNKSIFFADVSNALDEKGKSFK